MSRMPVVFAGHGSPLNAIEDNRWSRALRGLGGALPRPRAILAISAHWWVDELCVTAAAAPRTIHDFSGFPDALYQVRYRAPGDPALAARVRALLGDDCAASPDRGLDHGAWSVLCHTHPAADVPVVQLSLDGRRSPAAHLELAQRLLPLRDEGVLLLASGNVTHNLGDAIGRWQRGDDTTPEWARRFDADAAAALRARDLGHLVAMWPDHADGRRAHPSPDHWLPVLYAAGASTPEDDVQFPIEGFDLGSLSMRAAVFAQRG